VTVIILSAVVLLIGGAVLRLSLTERRLTIRNALVLESRNAAEAIAEYGFAQIREKFETRSTFTLDPADDDALVAPPASFWTHSNVASGSGEFELIGGTMTTVASDSSSYYYVDPNNLNNRQDPLRGKWVWRRDISVLAQATVRHYTGSNITSHATQTISVRGAPLFAHAIFYNMDLEIFPGPEMNIFGPVHANGDLYLAHQSANSSLNFHSQVTTSGHLFHSWKHGVGGNHGNETLQNGHVKFINSAGELISIRKDLPNNQFAWNDSRLGGTDVSTDFRSFAADTWNGNLLTAAHGITDYRPVAIGEYREADPTNPSVALETAPDGSAQDPSNSGRLIIEPPAYPTDPSDPDYATRKEIEYQKYANDAGIYIKIVPPTTLGGSATITVSSRSKSDPSKNKPLTLPAGNDVVKFGAYRATATGTGTTTSVTRTVGAKITSGANRNRFPVTTVTNVTNTPITRTYGAGGITGDVAGSATTTNGTPSVTYVTNPPAAGTTTSTTAPTFGTPSLVTGSGGNAGLYDRRRKKGVNLVDIDMDGLRKAVASMGNTSTRLSDGTTHTPTANDGFGNLQSSDWTGIVYVEVADAPTTDPITGATNYSTGTAADVASATAVRILKGKGRVPSHGTANEGLTIATNAPLYVQGDYNADGNTSTAATTNSARVPESGELPAALVADSITLLSNGFDPNTTLTVNRPGSSGSLEISAALLAGIAPTNPTLGSKGESSGGAHNFPRFLESWGHPVFIRGSIVALFESRVATEPWSTDYYGAPARNWGFNDLFAQGRYPPGTPRVMSYRRVNFEHLGAPEYQAAKEAYGWN
jgi:hypothetical protein